MRQQVCDITKRIKVEKPWPRVPLSVHQVVVNRAMVQDPELGARQLYEAGDALRAELLLQYVFKLNKQSNLTPINNS
jgi:hypothetical protein